MGCVHDFMVISECLPTQKLFCVDCLQYYAFNVETKEIVEWDNDFQLVFEMINDEI